MKKFLFGLLMLITTIILLNSCANIVPPSGGDKDITPPKLVAVYPGDSLLNTRVTEIELEFDEFVVLNSPTSEIQVSPVLPFPVQTEIEKRSVIISIPDSLLKENTTYRITFGEAIKDLHEGNTFTGYGYMFSTGSYFDSLKLNGVVTDAATGEAPEKAVILLYDADEPDSAVVRKKPMYVANVSGGGGFTIEGLPNRSFRIYALKDENANLIYDGEEEKIAFIDSIVVPVDSIGKPIQLRLFKEEVVTDSTIVTSGGKPGVRGKPLMKRGVDDRKEFLYTVEVDTTDTTRRTYDITKPLYITYNHPIDTYDVSKVFLTYDSSGADVEADFSIIRDTSDNVLKLNSNWQEDAVYAIRIYKDFATDTTGNTSLPSKHIFRTKSDNDYGILVVQLLGKYYNADYILQITGSNDTAYQKTVTDTVVRVNRLAPGSYTIRVIVDENGNGKWDTGDLFAKRQPEMVYAHTQNIELKAGWEAIVEFVEPGFEKVGENVPGKPGMRREK